MKLLFEPLPHTEAAARISSLPALVRGEFDQLLPELKAYAFTVSGLTQLGAITEARDAIAKVPLGERTWAEVKKELTGKLSPFLEEGPAKRRAELLLRTHTFRGYAATRYRSLMAQKDVFPYWQYKTFGDGKVRPAHRELQGRIFPAGHPIWQRIFPPWGWGCRCLVVPMMKGEVNRLKDAEQDKAPENKRVWDGELADAIHAGERLPSGISLAQDKNWNWEPGALRPDLASLRKRYEISDPEAWGEFERWAKNQSVTGDSGPANNTQTIWTWLEGAPLNTPRPPIIPPPVIAPVPTPVVKPRTLATINTEMTALESAQSAARVKVADLQKRWTRSFVSSLPAADVKRIHDELMAAKAELAAGIEAARELVSVPTAERGRVRIAPSKAKRLRAHAEDGGRIVERHVHASLMTEVHLAATRKRRAFHTRSGGKSTIHISSSTGLGTVAHEITHAVEQADSATLSAARDFLLARAKGAPALPLRRLVPGSKYDVHEKAFEDEWVKLGGKIYTGKDYGARATEILTMGIERLHADPLLFWQTDREYFEFVVKTLQKITP